MKLRISPSHANMSLVLAVAGGLAAWFAIQALGQSPVAARIYDVGSDKQLFIDGTMIAKSRGVTLTMNPAIKTGERNIVSEFPWENFYVEAATVMEDQGVYKMWYDASSWFEGLSEGGIGRFQCYATSTDGIHWEKPKLGVVEFQHSTDNNIVLAQSLGTVFLDPEKSDGNGYKFAGWWDKKNHPGFWLFTSPDGIHWSHYLDHPVLTKGQFDTQNEAFWDDGIKKWVAYVRRWSPLSDDSTIDASMADSTIAKHHSIRKVGRSETADIAHWPEPNVVFSADSKDTSVSDHYTPAVIKYPWAPHAYFMFPSAYYHYPEREMDGPLDIQMAASRDGIHWNRLDRRPYVRLGITGSEDGGSMYMAIGMIPKGDEIWMYYSGFDFTHGAYSKDTLRKGVISRVVQRMDGFVSADAAYEGGELTTVPIKFSGRHLVLNIDTGALGFAQIEIEDPQGHPYPGFSAKDSERLNGNFIRHEVNWNGKSDLSSLAGRPVQLRFVMRSAKLYAYTFAP